MRTVSLTLLLAACTVGGDGEVPVFAVDDLGYADALSPARVLTRASLDLRGVRPTEAELDAVESHPDLIAILIDDYLRDGKLQTRTRELFADVYRTRTDAYLVDVSSYAVSEQQRARLQRDAGDEPLRVVGHIAAEDLDVTELVTADWSLANKTLGEVFPVDYPDGESGWQVVQYEDGRPAAGVLTTNGMWWRYDSTDSNANRKRANQISRILLCDDFLDRPVEFDRTQGIFEQDFEERTQSDPSCAACHQALDPMASYLYGFSYFAFGGTDVTRYHPSRERMWQTRTGIAPAFNGDEGQTLADLGQQIAADPRFEQCLAENVFSSLVGQPPSSAQLEKHTAALAAQGTFRSLFDSVVRSESYIEGDNPAKLAAPALLASQVEDLTGFVWEVEDIELMTSDLLGYLSLAGGADGYTVTERATEPSATILLVQERLAELASVHAVEQTLADPGSVALLDKLDPAWRPGADGQKMGAQLSVAHRRALGRVPSEAELDDLLALWDELFLLEGDAATAWAGTLSTLLRDPDFLLY